MAIADIEKLFRRYFMIEMGHAITVAGHSPHEFAFIFGKDALFEQPVCNPLEFCYGKGIFL
ncbi:MAG TPA: hypothetical protein PK587_05595 [Syntrophales bacterium]|nr:hypothetical protein [Syntrophales bacterium]